MSEPEARDLDELEQSLEQELEEMRASWPSHPSRVRPDIRDSLVEYAERGVPLGDFLQAVIANDLMDAAGRADAGNALTLCAIAGVVYNELPSPCWGSRRCYRAWIGLHSATRRNDQAAIEAAKAEVESAYRESRSR